MPIGVKVTEIDASLYSNSSYANPCLAVIGTATKGPVGVPTLCINQKDLRSKFGLQNPNCLGLYAANYFLSEVNRCYYIRVAKDALSSVANIPGTTAGSTTDNLLVVESVSPGTFYDGYSVVISDATTESFTLTIKNSQDSTIFTKAGINLDVTSDNYIGKVLEDSDSIRLKSFSGITGTVYTPTNGTYILSGGDNGITGLTSSEYVSAFDLIIPDTIDIEVVVTPGVTDASVIQKGLTVSEKRGDLLYVVDPPSGLDYEEAIAWHNGIGEEYSDHTTFNSSYGALYWSWQYIYDEVNSQEVLVPPSVLVPAVYARNDNMSQPWFAPAGLTRGIIRNALRSEFVPDSDVQDLLYTDPNNINPIITHATSGLVVFGQKTLWRQPISLNRVNVRRLVTYIKRIAKDVSQYLVFEPNDSTTWNHFQDLMDPRLRSIKENRGLYDYKIIKGADIVTDDDIDNYRMPAQILIKPTKSAEFIPIDIVITSTGTNFNDYTSAYAE